MFAILDGFRECRESLRLLRRAMTHGDSSFFIFVLTKTSSLMEDVKRFLLDQGIVLSPQQLSDMVASYLEERISDYDSIIGREKKLFAGRHSDETAKGKARYYAECKICLSPFILDNKKWCKHIESHFDRMPPRLQGVGHAVVCNS